VSTAELQNTIGDACNSRILHATLSRDVVLAYCNSSKKSTFAIFIQAVNKSLHAISRTFCKSNNKLHAALDYFFGFAKRHQIAFEDDSKGNLLTFERRY